ncbi:hypothetical protein BH23CHL2_BH23CHL2_01020 [soil metagenome]
MSSLERVPIRWLLTPIGIVLIAILILGQARPAVGETPPAPIDPNNGEQKLLDIINAMPLNDIDQALDHFPVPYVVVAQAGSGPPVIANNRAGAPTRVDADSSKSTGNGGHDIEVEVNTELGANNALRLDINRIGNAPYASNLKVLIAFPFDAFNSESLPGAPNLFIGYETTAVGGGVGGVAPLTETIVFTPTTLAGTTHAFTTAMTTSGATNPLRFIMGHFDGTNLTGILNAAAMSALVEPVPASITTTVSVDESALSPGPGGTYSSFDIDWTASAPAKVTFDYIEEESVPGGDADYGTQLIFDQMPTNEHLSLVLDEAAETLELQHTASAVVDSITFSHRRDDGLDVTGSATDVPTSVSLTLDLDGAATLDVNANTLDLQVTAEQDGGFAGTGDFFGYLIGYLEIGLVDAADLTAAWDASTRSFSVQATNAGEEIGAISLLAGDDSQLELPPGSPGPWTDTGRHVFSLVDDGSHGTVAGRLANVVTANLSLTTATLTESFNLTTSEPTPLTAYLKTSPAPPPGSSIVIGKDIEATCKLEDVPSGAVVVTVKLPDDVKINLPEPIETVHCFGHIDSLNFDVLASKVPKIAEWKFDPSGLLKIKAEDGTGPNSAEIGAVAIRFWDNTPTGLPYGSSLFGEPLKDARARGDKIPSMTATWSDAAGSTKVDVAPDANTRTIGGVQVSVSTNVEFNGPLPEADSTSGHYLRFVDGGSGQKKSIQAGAFGIKKVDFDSNDTQVDAIFNADLARNLEIRYDSAFGGRFFPNYDVDMKLEVLKSPATLEVHTNLKESLSWVGSAPISTVKLSGKLDLTNNNNAEDLTDVFVSVDNVPSSVSLDFDATNGQGSATANGQIERVIVELKSDGKIFGTKYKWFNAAVDGINTNWMFVANINPQAKTGYAKVESSQPLGTVSIVLSNETKAASADNLDPFKNVDPNRLVARSGFQKVIDDRYFAVGIQQRLSDLYQTTFRLDGNPLEDHVVVRSFDSMDFTAIQFTGFKGLEADITETSAKATLKAPSSGTHPLFVGYQSSASKYLMVQVEDVPDEITVDVLADQHAYFDASSSPGRIDAYQGPLPFAGEATNALRAILKNTPSSVHLDYGDLDSFPGGGSFQASQQFEAVVLVQDSSSRIVAGLQMEDFSVNYGLDGLGYTPCDPVDFEIETLDTCYGIFRLQGGINALGDVSNQGASGFFVLYDLAGTPQALVGGDAVAADGAEYVPRLTFLLDNFTSFSSSFEIQFDPLAIPGATPLWPIDVELNINGPNADAFVFDFWDLGFDGVCFTPPFSDEVCAGANPPDYIDNNPWHIVPLFHGSGSHFDPY